MHTWVLIDVGNIVFNHHLMDSGIRNKERLVVGRFEQACLLDTISKVPPGETHKSCYAAQQEMMEMPEEPWPGLGLSSWLGCPEKTQEA